MEEIFDYALSLGGTITGEHGVGVATKAFLPRQLGGDTMRLLKAVKASLDPKGLMNPRKMFD